MHDLVLSEEMARAREGAGLVNAASLPNFKSVSPKDARAAAKQRRVLLHVPSYEIDDGALLDVGRMKGAVVFALSDLLRERGFRRAILVSKMRLLLLACRRAKCGFVFATLARDGHEERTAREIVSFSAVIGILPEEKKGAEELMVKLSAIPAKGAKK